MRDSTKGQLAMGLYVAYIVTVASGMSESIPNPMNNETSLIADAVTSPFNTEFIMVQCCGLRFMAYQDEAGKWRTAYEHRVLPGQVQVLW